MLQVTSHDEIQSYKKNNKIYITLLHNIEFYVKLCYYVII